MGDVLGEAFPKPRNPPAELAGRPRLRLRDLVTPVGDEKGLRHLAWIEGNRRKVEQMTNGRVAYIHMPVPIERDDDDFHRPLRELGLPAATELYLGVVHAGDGTEGTRARIAFLLGAGLGKATLVAFLVGLAATGVVALAVIANRGLGARKDMLPLAPFLALGAVVALLTTG